MIGTMLMMDPTLDVPARWTASTLDCQHKGGHPKSGRLYLIEMVGGSTTRADPIVDH